jgi:membrane-associated phospholipid phosphatase
VSWSRIASGAHFFSDTVVSFFVMLIVTDVLYYYMIVPEAERRTGLAPRPAILVTRVEEVA